MRMLLVGGAIGLLVVSLAAVSFIAFAGSSDESSAAEPVRRIGLMHVGIDHVPKSRDSLKARLAELGWTEGRNIELIWRNLKTDEAPEQAREFVRQRVDVIVAFEDSSIRAAQEATARVQGRIPVVFLHPTDPVRDGLVKTLSHPGGNLTGVFGARDLVAKQLELYQLVVPRLRRVLTLIDPEDKGTERLLKQYRAAAAELPLELDIREASTPEDLTRIFRSLRRGEVDGAFLLSSSLRLNHTALTLRLAERARLPVQAHRKDWVEQGALFSYGLNLDPVGRLGARYVDRILRGTPPADLSVETVPDVEFVINLKTASRLGIRVPQDMIVQADEVYR
jgi:putative ABC transport system substrate-binding protein